MVAMKIERNAHGWTVMHGSNLGGMYLYSDGVCRNPGHYEVREGEKVTVYYKSRQKARDARKAYKEKQIAVA